MFENLTGRFDSVTQRMSGRGRITDENIQETVREVRKALLEADVALPVVRSFTEEVKKRAEGAEVAKSLTPGQAFIKIVQDELVRVMGEEAVPLNLNVQPPAVVLVAGLQGSGKTTSIGKLARYLREREKKKVLVVSCDVYRPAAIDQLETLAGQVEVDFFPSSSGDKPERIARDAIDHAKRHYYDVLLVDTAGRLTVDEAMMDEVKRLHKAVTPAETLFVVDAMTGQDAAKTAQAFGEALPLTGVVLTKTDGDARGGAALSVRHVTGAPIKFLGIGEKTDALEPFHPERVASRILGKGDVVSLVEEVERSVDQEKAKKLEKKLKKGGKGFDLNDFKEQMQQIDKLGGLGGVMDKMPGMGKQFDKVKDQLDDRIVRRQLAMINSMTPAERAKPDIINGSRKKRIATGSGVQVQDLNRLLKQFKQMQKMMKQVKKKGGAQRMFQQLMGGGSGGPGGPAGPGGLPPGMGR
ncbi:MAG: signal recognition particle protein [Halorhodospira halophila]|uniref:signal recognition particle protein n=1 Tax=Halorhodospira TaxID=85108 RepID=UPI0019121AB7|nr:MULTISPECIES: signal recognition particle protein [Halorhodospira]MBK5937459.1 signal recognition particle protein [Halorhodospira halophila]MBK5942770.1 signal recognition particle protein [Halorhodospira halophila]MCC3751582.1 signal recognition particle protein [Halorhodospira halophila]MCG5529110.1 signal recognition particle protein [Halorhodospira halophila]MCG5534051.1 signal recognition particle protein [Halorhodospira sp. 9621]